MKENAQFYDYKFILDKIEFLEKQLKRGKISKSDFNLKKDELEAELEQLELFE